MVASCDLGRLGARIGPVAMIHWSPPSPLTLLPWAILLGLLWLPSNRTAQAWAIGLPLLVALGVLEASGGLIGFIPSEALDALGQSFRGLAFGVAALGLLPSARRRWVTLLRILGVLTGFCALTVTVVYHSQGDYLSPALFCAGFIGLCTTLACGLAGWRSKDRSSLGRFTLGLLAGLVVAWLVVMAVPYVLIGLNAGDSGDFALRMTLIALAAALISFAVWLPFLALAALMPFHRQRLLGRPETPDVSPAPAPPEPAPAQ